MALEKIKSVLAAVFDREFFGEFLSTFMMILIGNGSVAQYMLINEVQGDHEPVMAINCGYASAVAFGVYVGGGVSGAHMNPAVSIALAVVRKFEWVKVPKYIAGQMLGAFLATLLVFVVYLDRLRHGDDLIHEDTFRGIFATYPHELTTIEGRVLDQVVGTMILLLLMGALMDKNNVPPPPGLQPLLVGLIVFAIGSSFGTNCGGAINPARDLAPRLVSLMVGYDGTFSIDYFWVPIVGPIIGGIVGATAYLFIIERPARDAAGGAAYKAARNTSEEDPGSGTVENYTEHGVENGEP